ncbi:glycosyltransferase family 2 protein [Pararhodospirillum photometricum]|uniref:Glycosyl transferase, family 2 n=1 Tax=Pararhodospirillum photometricum DSM 122 TaxID=1150469 RepID=H6SR61_PARPM|nr:glycosyltransferase family 2 protein [Pararhodospirillum photometricum]CCG09783.1 Glycosyl transferase, family 2 [Pararhodospirillum photometricum DSM 122]
MSDTPVAGLLSIVIPLYNEEDNVDPLCSALFDALTCLTRPYEVIMVDDGSSDATAQRLAAATECYRALTVVTFRRNVGQTAAMMAGIDHAQGDIIIPMDGDLQNDPRDIPLLLAKLDEGFDVVSGWRKERQDDALTRTFPSKIANWLISTVSGVPLSDYGCTLKAYRREVLSGYRLYGEMHRFVPIYARWQGARITEVPVRHHPRVAGKSKYGLNRIIKVLLDLMVVKFLTQFETKPIYVFGGLGFFLFVVAFFSLAGGIWLRLFEDIHLNQTPLMLLSAMCVITGMMCMLLGLVAELLVRIYFESQGKTNYTIKSVIRGQPSA